MNKRRGAAIAALIAVFLAVGTAFAASPSLVPSVFSGSDSSAHASAGAAALATRAEAIEALETVAATESAEPSTSAEVMPSAAELARVLDDLKIAGIPATADELQMLASKVGLGNAVRILAFANASGKSPDEILAMFQSGEGWGRIASDLNLTIDPGIGGIMSGGRHETLPSGSPVPSSTPVSSGTPLVTPTPEVTATAAAS